MIGVEHLPSTLGRMSFISIPWIQEITSYSKLASKFSRATECHIDGFQNYGEQTSSPSLFRNILILYFIFLVLWSHLVPDAVLVKLIFCPLQIVTFTVSWCTDYDHITL
jgi:hypothetical protein